MTPTPAASSLSPSEREPFARPAEVMEVPLAAATSPMYRVVTESGGHLSVLLEKAEAEWLAAAINAYAPSRGAREVVERHRRHVELSPGVGADVQCYALGVLDDVLIDLAARAPSPGGEPGPLGWYAVVAVRDVEETPGRCPYDWRSPVMRWEGADRERARLQAAYPDHGFSVVSVEPVGAAPEEKPSVEEFGSGPIKEAFGSPLLHDKSAPVPPVGLADAASRSSAGGDLVGAKGARLDEGEPTHTDWLNWLEAYMDAVVDGEEVLPINAGQADHLRFVLADLRSAGGPLAGEREAVAILLHDADAERDIDDMGLAAYYPLADRILSALSRTQEGEER